MRNIKIKLNLSYYLRFNSKSNSVCLCQRKYINALKGNENLKEKSHTVKSHTIIKL